MVPINDDTFDRLMTRHLSARLDGQLGRAEWAFLQRLDDAGSTPADAGSRPGLSQPSPGFWQRPAGRIASVATTAVAASLATMLLLPKVGVQPVGPTPTGSVAVAPEIPPAPTPTQPTPSPDQPTMRYVHNWTVDEGTVSRGDANTAIRQLRHQQVERYRYYDTARGAWVDVVIPQEGVELYELDTY